VKKRECDHVWVWACEDEGGMAEMRVIVEMKMGLYERVRGFWVRNGVVIGDENGGGSFKSGLVERMKELHGDMSGGTRQDIIHRRILEILGEQRLYMIQFECCLDEFNGYLGALRVLDTMMQYGI
jgi:hypothetical protein